MELPLGFPLKMTWETVKSNIMLLVLEGSLTMLKDEAWEQCMSALEPPGWFFTRTFIAKWQKLIFVHLRFEIKIEIVLEIDVFELIFRNAVCICAIIFFVEKCSMHLQI